MQCAAIRVPIARVKSKVSGSYTLDEAVDDVLRTADQLAISRFHLVGHSMSALVAQKIGLAAAARIQSVTLFSPVPPTGFHADEAAMKALNAVIEDDEAAGRAIAACGLTAPMHVVNGALDIPFYRGDTSHNSFATAYPQATFEMIDDAGHYSMLETPVRVAGIIEKHVGAAA